MTQIIFNAEGDLLFSASKDNVVNVWFTSNGERLGTFNGHNGSVWTVSVDCECCLQFVFGMESVGELVRSWVVSGGWKGGCRPGVCSCQIELLQKGSERRCYFVLAHSQDTREDVERSPHRYEELNR